MLQYILYILIAVILFGLLIAVHEFGHFFTAKLLGVKVNEFAVGMGPRILHKVRGETEYSLRLLPIGGFCAMEGEDEETDDPRSFACQPGWKKFLILVAGSFMNFVAGVLIILVLFSQAVSFSSPVITGFMDGAEHLTQGGLREDDIFYRVDGHRTYFTGDVSLYLGRAGDFMEVEVIRDGARIRLENFDFSAKVPVVDENGQTVYMRGIYFGKAEAATPWLVVRNTWYQALDCVRTVWLSLGDLVTGRTGVRELSGVIGIVDAVGDAGASAATAAEGLQSVFSFMSLIAINLAVMNMLPIPALDGGRVFFLIVGGVFRLIAGRKLDPKYENAVNVAGFVLLMGLMILVAVSDVLKIAGV